MTTRCNITQRSIQFKFDSDYNNKIEIDAGIVTLRQPQGTSDRPGAGAPQWMQIVKFKFDVVEC